RLAPERRAADFDTVAEDVVAAVAVARRVLARIGGLDASVARAGDIVAAVGRRSRLAALRGTADLDAVAEQSVAARSIARRMRADVVGLIARVGRTEHVVVAVGRRSGTAALRRAARLDAVAEQSVAAQGVVRDVR